MSLVCHTWRSTVGRVSAGGPVFPRASGCWRWFLSLWPDQSRPEAQGNQAVDLELALLVDVSASVNDDEFRLQAGGLAKAFESEAVINAIRASAKRGIAVSVIQWANGPNQQVSVDWTLVRGRTDALLLAAQIASMPRLIQGGHTALGSALAFRIEGDPVQSLCRATPGDRPLGRWAKQRRSASACGPRRGLEARHHDQRFGDPQRTSACSMTTSATT